MYIYPSFVLFFSCGVYTAYFCGTWLKIICCFQTRQLVLHVWHWDTVLDFVHCRRFVWFILWLYSAYWNGVMHRILSRGHIELNFHCFSNKIIRCFDAESWVRKCCLPRGETPTIFLIFDLFIYSCAFWFRNKIILNYVIGDYVGSGQMVIYIFNAETLGWFIE